MVTEIDDGLDPQAALKLMLLIMACADANAGIENMAKQRITARITKRLFKNGKKVL